MDISSLSNDASSLRQIIRGMRSISTSKFFLVCNAIYFRALMQFVAPSTPYCHFETKRNSRLIGSRQGYMSHVISFIIGVSVDATGNEVRDVDVCIAQFFGSVLYVRWTTVFQCRHFVAFRNTVRFRGQ